MKKIYLLLLLLASIQAFANPVTPEAALNRLQGRNSSRIRGPLQTQRFSISEIITDSCGNNTVYLFESKDGFVVTPADDALPALLGYGEGQMRDSAGNLPIGFQEWLQYMNQRVSEAAEMGYSVSGCPSVGEAIAPLCKTAWGQGEPFNLECPDYYGEKCLSGCVATALAQIMKYHNWPQQGKGELRYHAQRIGTEIFTDFSEYTFDWENMLHDYSSTSPTEQQRQAVAHLLRGVGGSVQMNYSPTASGADLHDATKALLNYWDYSDDVRNVYRSWFSLPKWSQLLYDALKNYGPILYGGFSFTSAHAFVCDGYDGEGLFHFNWGWDGKADGYFAIDFLNPVVEGEEWKTGYNVGQSAILNIHPRNPENPGTRYYDVWFDSYYAKPVTGFLDQEPHTLHPGDSFELTGEGTNFSPFKIPEGSKFATVFTSFYDGSSVPSNIVELTSGIESRRSFDSKLKTVPEGLQNGLYALLNDVYISPSGWGNGIQIPEGVRYCALVENNGSDVRLIECIITPELLDSEIPDNICLNSETLFTATLFNLKPRYYERYVRAELIQDGIVKGWSAPVNAAFESKEINDFELKVDNWTWKNESISHAGDYLLCLSMRNSYGDIWIPMNQGKKVTVMDSASIDQIIIDDNSRDSIYDLHGRKVTNDINSLSPGLYIIRHNGVVSKIAIPLR